MLFRTEDEENPTAQQAQPRSSKHRKMGISRSIFARGSEEEVEEEEDQEQDTPGLFKRVIIRVAKFPQQVQNTTSSLSQSDDMNHLQPSIDLFPLFDDTTQSWTEHNAPRLVSDAFNPFFTGLGWEARDDCISQGIFETYPQFLTNYPNIDHPSTPHQIPPWDHSNIIDESDGLNEKYSKHTQNLPMYPHYPEFSEQTASDMDMNQLESFDENELLLTNQGTMTTSTNLSQPLQNLPSRDSAASSRLWDRPENLNAPDSGFNLQTGSTFLSCNTIWYLLTHFLPIFVHVLG
jgi:hypothetical protein